LIQKKNDVDKKHFPEKFIPNIKLFPSSNKENPVNYQGTRTLNDFLEFVHQHATIKFDLEAAKAKGKLLEEEAKKKER